jgi:hypothetical protein
MVVISPVGIKDVLWAQEKISKWFSKPYLKFTEIYVANYHYEDTQVPHYRKFINATIRNVGKEAAKQCYAMITINSDQVHLHWSDIPYEKLSSSTKKIDIGPKEPRRLDIAFSVYGSSFSHSQKSILGLPVKKVAHFSKQVPSDAKGALSLTTESTGSKMTMGTYDQRLSSYEPAKLHEAKSGAWIATHLSLLDPKYTDRDYISPARYDVNIELFSDKGKSESCSFTIISTSDASKLTGDERTLSIR